MGVRDFVATGARAIGRCLDSHGVAWVLGVGVPPLMLLLDPIVFRGSMFGSAALGAYRPGAYVGIGLGVTAMACALTVPRARAFLSGVLAVGSLLSFAVGVVILPLAVIGVLLLGLGLLGLTPLACAVLLAWWARRCFRESCTKRRLPYATAGAVAFCTACGVVQMAGTETMRSSTADIMSGRLRESRVATERLRRWSMLLDMDEFMPIWEQQTDPERRQRLAEAYRELTGEDLERRLHAD